MHKLIGRQDGFTFIELVIAITVIATVLAAVIEIFIVVGNLNAQSRHLATATAALQQKIENYRNIGFSNIPVSSNCPTTPTVAEDFSSDASLSALGSGHTAKTYVCDTTVSGLETVDVVITYPEKKGTKTVEASSYVSSRGISK